MPGPTTPDPTARRAARLARHDQVRQALDRLDDADVTAWLGGSDALLHDGHASLTLPDDETAVFVKLLAVTELEREPVHGDSTANCFDLPPCYGYRIGGAGSLPPCRLPRPCARRRNEPEPNGTWWTSVVEGFRAI